MWHNSLEQPQPSAYKYITAMARLSRACDMCVLTAMTRVPQIATGAVEGGGNNNKSLFSPPCAARRSVHANNSNSTSYRACIWSKRHSTHYYQLDNVSLINTHRSTRYHSPTCLACFRYIHVFQQEVVPLVACACHMHVQSLISP